MHSTAPNRTAVGPAGYDPIVLLVIGTSLLMASGSAVFTLLPAMQEEVGFATWGFGLIAGTFFAASLVAQLFLARLADRGRARALLVAAILLGVAGLALMSVAQSLVTLTVARAIGGLAVGAWAPAARAMAIARRPDRTATRLGFIAMGDTSGLVVGPLVAAGLAEAFSPATAFRVFAACVLLLTPVLFATPLSQERRPSGGGGLRSLVARRDLVQATLLAVALFLPVGLYETVWGKHISNLGGSSHIIALSVALYGLPYLVVAPLGGRLGDRVGPARVALAGAAVLAVITVVTGIPRNYWVLLVIGVVEAAASAVAYPNALAAVARACRADQQATGQGLAGGASIAGAGVMALLAGPLFAFGGPVVAFSATAVLVGALAGLAYALDPMTFTADPGTTPESVTVDGPVSDPA